MDLHAWCFTQGEGKASVQPGGLPEQYCQSCKCAVTICPPKLRNDLTIIEQRLAGEMVSIVKDPLTGNFFRLGEGSRPEEIVATKASIAWS